ncbi:MAG: fenitrothion hydrolase, partial [Thermoleophilaceae bacterium]
MSLFVLAHGLVGRTDLPIPKSLFGIAASLVLVISFAALAALWPQPQLQEERSRRLFRMPPLEPLAGALGVAAFGAVVYSGLSGAQDAQDNLAPTIVYVHFWVGMAVVSVLFGDVFRALNPWRAVARAVAWVGARLSRGETPAPLAYPAWLGRWPAAISILIFVWVELAYVNRDDPSQLAIMALAYAAFQLIGMAFYGIEQWEDR